MKKLNNNERFVGINYRYTNVAERFRKERLRLAKLAKEQEEAMAKVTPIKERKAK
jgi:hypothetical protein